MTKGARALGYLAMVPLGFLAWAYTDMRMWQWFAVPMGAPNIGMVHAYGLGMLGWTLCANKDMFAKKDEDKSDNDKLYETIGRSVGTPAIMLGLGKLVHMIAGLP